MHQSERNTPPDQAQAYAWFKQLIDLYTPVDTQPMHLKWPSAAGTAHPAVLAPSGTPRGEPVV